MTIEQLAKLAREKGYDIALKKRPGGGYGVAGIDGVKYDASRRKGNDALRALLGVQTPKQQEHELRETNAEIEAVYKKSPHLKGSLDHLAPRDKQLFKKVWTKARKAEQEGKVPNGRINIKGLSELDQSLAHIKLTNLDYYYSGLMNPRGVEKIIVQLENYDAEEFADIILYLENHETEIPLDIVAGISDFMYEYDEEKIVKIATILRQRLGIE